jgi:hypothetical protein
MGYSSDCHVADASVLPAALKGGGVAYERAGHRTVKDVPQGHTVIANANGGHAGYKRA